MVHTALTASTQKTIAQKKLVTCPWCMTEKQPPTQGAKSRLESTAAVQFKVQRLISSGMEKSIHAKTRQYNTRVHKNGRLE